MPEINLGKIKRHYDEAMKIIDVMEAVGFSVQADDVYKLKEHLSYLFSSCNRLYVKSEELDDIIDHICGVTPSSILNEAFGEEESE